MKLTAKCLTGCCMAKAENNYNAIYFDGDFHYSDEQAERDNAKEQHFMRKGTPTYRIRNSEVADDAKLRKIFTQ